MQNSSKKQPFNLLKNSDINPINSFVNSSGHNLLIPLILILSYHKTLFAMQTW